MPTLRSLNSGRELRLGSRLLVGRAAHAGLVLDDRRVSNEHASIYWQGARWLVRDLGSRNGTYLHGNRVEAGTPAPLSPGDPLTFGGCPEAWELVGAGPPEAVAVAGRRELVAVAGLLAIPPEEPIAEVYVDGSGRWVVEREGAVETIDDGAVLDLPGGPWRVHLPAAHGSTVHAEERVSLAGASLNFLVSRNGDHVALEVVHGVRRLALEVREHWGPLLVLAEERLKQAGAPPHEQGWLDLDRLERRSGLNQQALNVYIFRARQQLAAAGIEMAAQVVEVRRGQRRIGVAPERITVLEG